MKMIYIILALMAIMPFAYAQVRNYDLQNGITISHDKDRTMLRKGLDVLFTINHSSREFIAIGDITKTGAWGYTAAGKDVVIGDFDIIGDEYICLKSTGRTANLSSPKSITSSRYENDYCLRYKPILTSTFINGYEEHINAVKMSQKDKYIEVSYPADYDPEYINYSAIGVSTSMQFMLNTDYYNVTLWRGILEDYYSYRFPVKNWGFNGSASYAPAIGTIYNGSGNALYAPSTPIDCTYYNDTDFVHLDCGIDRINARTELNWSFYRSYISFIVYSNASYYIWMASGNNVTINPVTFGNGTDMITRTSFGAANWNSTTQRLSINYSDSTDFLAISYNFSNNNRYTAQSATSKGLNYSTWFIGYSSHPTPALTRTNVSIKLLPQNQSSSGVRQVFDLLDCFKADVLCNDTIAGGEPPASTCTWEPGADWVITDYCNITTSTDICPYKLVVNTTGKLNLSNNAIINASMFQFYPATDGWRLSITSGGFKPC